MQLKIKKIPHLAVDIVSHENFMNTLPLARWGYKIPKLAKDPKEGTLPDILPGSCL
jgi:hypothetical protein